MGLDVCYYEKIEPIAEADFDIDDQPGDVIDWDASSPGYPDPFKARRDGIVAEYVRVSGKSGGFRAGSYSGYNAWRDKLSRTVLLMVAESVWAKGSQFQGAFVELINFSDCEGAVGPKTCAKLAEDFAGWDASKHPAWSQYEVRVYDDFAKAFKVAAGEGCVVFT